MLLFYWYAVEDLSLCCQVTICAQRGPRIRTSNLSLIMPFPVEIIFLISYLSFSCNLFFLEKGEDKGGRVGFFTFFPYLHAGCSKEITKSKNSLSIHYWTLKFCSHFKYGKPEIMKGFHHLSEPTAHWETVLGYLNLRGIL